ncbi:TRANSCRIPTION FACTOR C3H FAMILY-RELATED [Salix koriyanagi]|uniref:TRANSCRIPTION FACTOR C3H FAMILY-RELATED n=1 Tax=Salix koriyanagi TaxID=2511006 RepID=A0A9Q0TFL2_9ROSI|nr:TRANSCRIPTION FACTOR C3H FAMILY-RELATED [Salix koriyanagi]
MDFSESTKVVYSRIQEIEPEFVGKIIGYILLQNHGEREMIRLAFSPDNLIYAMICRAKSDLGLNKKPVLNLISPSQVNPSPVSDVAQQFIPNTRVSSHPISSPVKVRTAGSFWDAQLTGDLQQAHSLDFAPPAYSEMVSEDYRIHNQMQLLTSDGLLEFVNSDFSGSYIYPEPGLSPRTSRRSPSLPEFPVKICHYFIKGFCKHGNNCRYFHGHPMPESFPQIFSSNSNEIANEECVVSPGSLEKLELELTELLKSRRGVPVSIASLPMIYYEMYGRTLQAEGYLTESQRHGKAGYSLTKLLARLKNSICLIDRPHGQHSVILAEDVPKYLEDAGERNDPGGIIAGSRQIYLTFPAESTFTEQDVSNYFSKFGPVQDVRIPCQQKRMFGFVTFVFAETVKQILAKGNPHHVCGARVLVKPYREKSRLINRKYDEKMQHPMEGDSELHLAPRVCDDSRSIRKQLMEGYDQEIEFERLRLLEFHFAPKPLNRHSFLGHSMDELKLSEEQAEFSSAEHFNYWLDDVLNNVSSCSDQDSIQGANLPDSPFSSAIRSGISTVRE